MSYYYNLIKNFVKSKSIPDFCDNMHIYCIDRFAYHYIASLELTYPECERKGYGELRTIACTVPCIYHAIIGFVYWSKCYSWQSRKFYYTHREILKNAGGCE